MVRIVYFRRLLAASRITNRDVGQSLVNIQRAVLATRAQQVYVAVKYFRVDFNRAFG